MVEKFLPKPDWFLHSLQSSRFCSPFFCPLLLLLLSLLLNPTALLRFLVVWLDVHILEMGTGHVVIQSRLMDEFSFISEHRGYLSDLWL